MTDEELHALHAAGVRGVRFDHVRRLVDALAVRCPDEDCRAYRSVRLAHRHLFRSGQELLVRCTTSSRRCRRPVVVDHIGRPDVTKPSRRRRDRAASCNCLRRHPDFWSKFGCRERLSRSRPPGFYDVVPFARRIVETFADRVLWGTDWPHPNLKNHMPDDGWLVDYIPRVAVTPALQQKLLVDNPVRLYWNN